MIMSQKFPSSYIPPEKILLVALIKTRFWLVSGYYIQSRSEDLIGGLVSNESFVRNKNNKTVNHLSVATNIVYALEDAAYETGFCNKAINITLLKHRL